MEPADQQDHRQSEQQHRAHRSEGVARLATRHAAAAVEIEGVRTRLAVRPGAALAALGADGAQIAAQLQSGTIPQVATLPESLRVIFEDVYATSIAHAFLIAVPVAVVSLIAIAFLPNVPLTRMTTSERIEATEADLATVSVSEGMDALAATGTITTPSAPAEPRDTDAGRERR